jgi:hypothetical protein
VLSGIPVPKDEWAAAAAAAGVGADTLTVPYSAPLTYD